MCNVCDDFNQEHGFVPGRHEALRTGAALVAARLLGATAQTAQTGVPLSGVQLRAKRQEPQKARARRPRAVYEPTHRRATTRRIFPTTIPEEYDYFDRALSPGRVP